MTPSTPAPTLDFAAGDFVGRENRNHFGHPGPAFERLPRFRPFVADRGDHGAFGADDHMRLQAQRFHSLDHVFDLFLGGVSFHDDDHRMAPEKSGDAGRMKKSNPKNKKTRETERLAGKA
jgi:hypothetical protein